MIKNYNPHKYYTKTEGIKISIFLFCLLIIFNISSYLLIYDRINTNNINKIILGKPETESCIYITKTIGMSMYPTIKSNEEIIIDKCYPIYNLKVGDIIAWTIGSIYIGHRIVFIDFDNELIITQGDNIDEVDPSINFNQYYGKIMEVQQ